jgi:hypothetical protein
MQKKGFSLWLEDEMSSLGMYSTFLMNLFFIGHFSLVGFEDLIREMNASSSKLEGASILKIIS